MNPGLLLKFGCSHGFGNDGINKTLSSMPFIALCKILPEVCDGGVVEGD
jgi:hypothetical protein